MLTANYLTARNQVTYLLYNTLAVGIATVEDFLLGGGGELLAFREVKMRLA